MRFLYTSFRRPKTLILVNIFHMSEQSSLKVAGARKASRWAVILVDAFETGPRIKPRTVRVPRFGANSAYAFEVSAAVGFWAITQTQDFR
jgi:hypothetical protein